MLFYSTPLLQDLNPYDLVVFGCASSASLLLRHVPSSAGFVPGTVAPAVVTHGDAALVIPGCLTPDPAAFPSTSAGPADSAASVP